MNLWLKDAKWCKIMKNWITISNSYSSGWKIKMLANLKKFYYMMFLCIRAPYSHIHICMNYLFIQIYYLFVLEWANSCTNRTTILAYLLASVHSESKEWKYINTEIQNYFIIISIDDISLWNQEIELQKTVNEQYLTRLL